jgi:hypothetical protein
MVQSPPIRTDLLLNLQYEYCFGYRLQYELTILMFQDRSADPDRQIYRH